MARMRWNSKLTFIMAAVGSAVGLGNVWRFPYLAGEYGGGAFLIPYFILLFAIGVPLLIGEFYLGQMFQKGAVRAYGSINKYLSGIGFFALLCGMLVISYYAAVMAWVWSYTFASFRGIPWAGQAGDYFFGNVLQISDSVGNVGGLVPILVLFLALTWIAIYFSIFKGVKSVGKVVMWTVPLPILLILVLAIRGVTLPGAVDGIIFYLLPDFSAIWNWEVWTAAATQIFFTLTLGFGVMVAYSSYNKEKDDFVGNAYSTALINSGISILSGFAVFTTLGYMATQTGVSLAELSASGPGLAFVVFPEALSLMPVAAGLFSLLFFIALLTLGIDSAFSLVEAITASVKDRFPKAKHEIISFWVCLVMFLAGLIYVTRAGLYFLDIVDHFITSYGIILVGLLQCIVLGWILGTDKVKELANQTKGRTVGGFWVFTTKYLTPIVLIVLIGTSLYKDITTPYEGYASWALAVGWLAVITPLVISAIFSFCFAKDVPKSAKKA